MRWTASFALARNGREKEAREQIQLSLQARQAALSTAVARLLVQNNESEEQAAAGQSRFTIACSGRCMYFWRRHLVAILLTGFYMIRWNRRLFRAWQSFRTAAASWRKN